MELFTFFDCRLSYQLKCIVYSTHCFCQLWYCVVSSKVLVVVTYGAIKDLKGFVFVVQVVAGAIEAAALKLDYSKTSIFILFSAIDVVVPSINCYFESVWIHQQLFLLLPSDPGWVGRVRQFQFTMQWQVWSLLNCMIAWTVCADDGWANGQSIDDNQVVGPGGGA